MSMHFAECQTMADNEAIVVVEYSMAPSQESDGRLAGEIWTTSKLPGTYLFLADMDNIKTGEVPSTFRVYSPQHDYLPWSY